jgi:hypothetical protein
MAKGMPQLVSLISLEGKVMFCPPVVSEEHLQYG